jgi:hypothetical protein
MHHGRSPEEIELAGEELSGFGSFTSLLKKIGKKSLQVTDVVTAIPGGRAVMSMLPLGAPMLAASEGAKSVKNIKSAAGIKSASKSAPEAPKTPSVSESKNHTPQMSGMGAELSLNDDDIKRLINRETNPVKQYRMILNFERARARRGKR